MIARASIRAQLRLLGAIAALGIAVVIVGEHALLRGAQARFDREEGASSVRRARQALARTIDAERRRITETAWWDEAYAYMAVPDGPAARHFIRTNLVDWLPAQYGDEFVSSWRPNRTPRFSWCAPEVAGLDTLLRVAALLARLDGEPLSQRADDGQDSRSSGTARQRQAARDADRKDNVLPRQTT